MLDMGRPRKPTAVHIANGNPSRLRLDLNSEPQPAHGFGPMPEGLSEFGQNIWTVTTAELDRMNLITVVDHGALVAAVTGADQAYQADVQIRELMQLTGSGKAEHEDYSRLSVMNGVSKKAWTQWKSFCTEFGLTPASRTRLTTAGATNGKAYVDPIEEALSEMAVQ